MTPSLKNLKVDIDRKLHSSMWDDYCTRVAGVLRIINRQPLAVQVDDSKKGHHIRVVVNRKLPNLAALIAVQSCLGSDPYREALNLTRSWSGRTDDWNILFLTKQKFNISTRATTSRFVTRYNQSKSITLARHLETALELEAVKCVVNAQQMAAHLLKEGNLRSVSYTGRLALAK